MLTLETMEETELEARLLQALEQVNDRRLIIEHPTMQRKGKRNRNANRTASKRSYWTIHRKPMMAEWLRAAGFIDTDINRWSYYAVMEELIGQGLIDVESRPHGTACRWRYFILNNAGHERLNMLRSMKVF